MDEREHVNERRRLVRFLLKGGVLLEDVLPPPLADRWRPAHLSGEPFDTGTCHRLRDRGLRHRKERYELAPKDAPGGSSLWELRKA